MAKQRNQFLEADGLQFESETHEWFKDNVSTNYAQDEDEHGTKLPDIFCFVVRDKATGEYDRVILDNKTHEVIYSTGSLEAIGSKIDMLKAIKRFK